ncbi:hypothetical protein [uncultured Methylobacterium sp.]|uniref:hypothetical protein n=1 Tax=uncultured Methylobacterium sp. TaxID=157278 RepID=UPI0035CA1E73
MTDSPRMLAREFDTFVEAVGIADAPASQKREMRRAFFAGARAYSGFIMRHASGGDEPTAEDLAMMEALEVEMAAFLDDMMKGRA